MMAKKILAGIFAVLVLLKILALLISPAKWMNLSGLVLTHSTIIFWVYVVLLVITAYFIFSSLKLIDIALVMFFTSLLIGLTLISYSAPLMKIGAQITSTGIGKAWLSLVIWGVLALAVLIQVISKKR
jgi:hypothetical protein